jgi:type II secretory pathway pseudopilin PulG
VDPHDRSREHSHCSGTVAVDAMQFLIACSSVRRFPTRNLSARTLHARGFTLIEVGIALFIMMLVLAGVIGQLGGQIENRKIDETDRMLTQAREALLAHAAAYGYFPCPADASSSGQEPAAGVNHATGACPSYYGFVPASLLNMTPLDEQGFATDGWGGSAANRLRYAVSDRTLGTIAAPFTRTGGMSAAGVRLVGGANNLLYVCGSGIGVNPGVDCGTAQTLATNAVALVWSVGPNAGGGGTSVHEAENPNPSGGSVDPIFVSRARSIDSGPVFDDVLIWISAPMMITRLVAAGQLP